MEFRLRDFQREDVNAIHAAYEAGVHRQLAVLATGLGKTEEAVQVAREVDGKTLFLVHRDELAQQTLNKFAARWPNASRGLVKAECDELGRRVTVASVQTVYQPARLARLAASGPYRLVVADEAHHSVSKSWRAVLDATVDADTLLLGLTATPGRADGARLTDVFQKITVRRDIVWGISTGWLSDIEGLRVDLNVDLDAIEVNDEGDFKERPLAQVMTQAEALRGCVSAWQQHAPSRRTIAFCVNVEHATQLAGAFASAGVRAEVVTGETDIADRRRTYRDLREGRVRVLCSCMVLTEGWDEPSVDGVLLCRPTTSQSLYVQMVGRGIRPFPGKDRCLLLDMTGASEKHSLAQLGLLVGFDPDEVMMQTDKKKRKAAENGEAGVETPDHVTSFIEFAAKARKIDLVNTAWARRRYSWVETRYGFGLDLGHPELGFLIMRPAKNTEGLYRVVHVRFEKGWRQQFDVLTEPLSADFAMGLAESEATRFLGGSQKSRWQTKDSDWRGQRPTAAQEKAIERAGLAIPKTRGEAAQVLTGHTIEKTVAAFAPAAAKTADGDRVRGHLKHLWDQNEQAMREAGIVDREACLDLGDEDARRLRARLYRAQKEAEERAAKGEAA